MLTIAHPISQAEWPIWTDASQSGAATQYNPLLGEQPSSQGPAIRHAQDIHTMNDTNASNDQAPPIFKPLSIDNNLLSFSRARSAAKNQLLRMRATTYIDVDKACAITMDPFTHTECIGKGTCNKIVATARQQICLTNALLASMG